MFRHGSGNSNLSDGRATPSRRFSGFQEDFCTHLIVFIITLCSSIRLRQNWCRWKAKKKLYNLKIRTANWNVHTERENSFSFFRISKWVSGRLAKIRESFEIPFSDTKTVHGPDAQNCRLDACARDSKFALKKDL
jgi:hypothetical protein